MTLTLDKTGERLDAALARLVPSLSRSQAQRLIEQGAVTHGGRPMKKNEKLSAGDTLELTLPEVREVPIEAQPIPPELLLFLLLLPGIFLSRLHQHKQEIHRHPLHEAACF